MENVISTFNVPLDIMLKALFYPVVNYKKEYDCDKTINLANGEITKPNEDPERYPDDVWIGSRFLGSYWNNEECDTIQVYLGKGYFKLISRVK